MDISECSKDDPEIEEVKTIFERAVAMPLRFKLDGHDCEASLDDVFRGLVNVRDLVYFLGEHAPKGKTQSSRR